MTATQIHPRFEVTGYLGEGGFGTVYRALDLERRERVAIKVLHRRSPAALFAFKKEFRSLARVTHPNLISLYELFCEQEPWFFSMEIIEGGDFLSYVRNCAESRTAPRGAERHRVPITVDLSPPASTDGRPAEPAEPVDRVRLSAATIQLIDALEALHGHGFLHLDIKPSNVLVTREGRLVLLDFGLLQQTADAEDPRGALGTPGYMPPEQALGRKVSAASDWYSVGCMLHEAIAGRLPAEHPVPDGPRGDPLLHLCERLLDEDEGRRPSPPEIRAAIASGAPAGDIALPHIEDPVFIGRVIEREEFRRGVERWRNGAPTIIRVQGKSGLGKSALCRRMLSDLSRKTSTLLLEGRCYEREYLPYKALDGVVDALSRRLRGMPPDQVAAVLPKEPASLRQIFPVLGQVQSFSLGADADGVRGEPVEERRRGFRAMRELLERLTEGHDVVVYIDDLQWGDIDSVRLLQEIFAPPRPPRLLLVLAYRDDDLSVSGAPGALGEALVALHDTVELVDIPLGPMTASDSAELVHALMTTQDPSAIGDNDQIVRDADGVPFLIRLITRQGKSGATWGASGATLPGILRGELDGIPSETRRLLESIAIAARPSSSSLVVEAAGSGASESALDLLIRKGWIVVRGPSRARARVECAHDQIRAAILALMSQERQTETHLHWGEVLEHTGQADPEQIFGHYDAAGAAPRAVSFALLAAERAESTLAFDRAATLYQSALKWPEHLDAPWRVQASCGNALFNAGRTAEAGTTLSAAARDAPVSDQSELERRAAEAWLIAGRIDDGARLLAPRVKRFGGALDRSVWRLAGSILTHLIWLRFRGVELETRSSQEGKEARLEAADLYWSLGKGLAFVRSLLGVDYVLRSLRYAFRSGDSGRIARTLAFLAGGVFFQVPMLRSMGRRCLDKAAEIATSLSDPFLVGTVSLWRGMIDIGPGNWSDAQRQIEEGLQVLEEQCVGVHWERVVAAGLLAWLHQHRGDLVQSHSLAARYYREGTERGDLYSQVLFTQYLAYAEIARGMIPEARRRTRWITEEWQQGGYSVPQFYAMLLDVLCDLYEGRIDAAQKRWEQDQSSFRRSGGHRVPASRMENNLLEARILIRSGSAKNRRGRQRLEKIGLSFAKEQRRDGMAWAAWVKASLEMASVTTERRSRNQLPALEATFSEAGLLLAARCVRMSCAPSRVEAALAEEAIRSYGVAEPRLWARAYLPLPEAQSASIEDAALSV